MPKVFKLSKWGEISMPVRGKHGPFCSKAYHWECSIRIQPTNSNRAYLQKRSRQNYHASFACELSGMNACILVCSSADTRSDQVFVGARVQECKGDAMQKCTRASRRVHVHHDIGYAVLYYAAWYLQHRAEKIPHYAVPHSSQLCLDTLQLCCRARNGSQSAPW